MVVTADLIRKATIAVLRVIRHVHTERRSEARAKRNAAHLVEAAF
jgi:hypothetical protein